MRLFITLIFGFAGLILFGQYNPEAPFKEPDYPKGEFRNPLGITNYLSGNFGELRNNHFHTGIDIKTNQKEGYNVYAVGDGYISRINVSPRGYGLAIYIDHPNGYTTVYAHLQKFNSEIEAFVREYQYANEKSTVTIFPKPKELPINKGDIIALSGNSGGSGGPHLHFEIRHTETEEPVNPFLFGFDIPDSKNPIVNGLYIYPLTGNVVGKTSRHQLPSGLVFNSPIYASGKVGLGIKAYDKHNGAENLNGVYQINVYVNDEPAYTYTNDRLNFDRQRALNNLIDYKDRMTNNSWVYRLFRSDGDPLQNYSNLKNNGIIDLQEGEEYAVRIEVLDYAGNRTIAKYKLIGKKSPDERQANSNSTILKWNEDTYFSEDGIELWMRPGVVYEDIELDYRKTNNGKYQIHDYNVPMHSFFTLGLNADHIPVSDLSKLMIIREYKYRGSWRKDYFPAEFRNGKAYAEVRGFGTYSVGTDITKPSISPINIKENSTFTASKGVIRFTISDSETGIKDFDIHIDGKWVLGYHDKNSLTIDLNKEGISDGKHYLELKVWDEKDNTAIYTANFNKN